MSALAQLGIITSKGMEIRELKEKIIESKRNPLRCPRGKAVKVTKRKTIQTLKRRMAPQSLKRKI